MKGNRIIERDSLLVLKNQLTLCKDIDYDIPEQDKGQSWDGNIFLYEQGSDDLTKSKLIGPIPIQVKGTTLLKVGKESFRMERDDLDNYRRNGGAVLFVIDDNRKIVFYKSLLPVFIQNLFDKGKKGQKSYSIKLDRFHTSKEFIYSSLFSFYQESKWQIGLNGRAKRFIDFQNIDGQFFCKVSLKKSLNSIILNDELVQPYHEDKFGMITPVSMIKPGELSIPLDFELNFSGKKKSIVTHGRVNFNTQESDQFIELNQQIKIFPCRSVQNFSYDLNTGTITQSLITLEILKNFYEGRTCYWNKKNWAAVEKNEVALSEIKTLISMLNNIKKLEGILDIDIRNRPFTENEIHELSYLYIQLSDCKKTTTKASSVLSPQLLQIGSLRLGLLIEQDVPEPCFFDLFNSRLEYGEEGKQRLPAFVLATCSILINAMNLSLPKIECVLKKLSSYILLSHCNVLRPFICELVHAYLNSNNIEFLNIAYYISGILSQNNSSEIDLLNLLMIKYLQEKISSNDTKQLIKLLDISTDINIKWGACVLMKSYEEANTYFNQIPEQRQMELKTYPLYEIYEKSNRRTD
jgi:hypothetical protein